MSLSVVVDQGGVNVSERRRGQHDESLDESVDETEGDVRLVFCC